MAASAHHKVICLHRIHICSYCAPVRNCNLCRHSLDILPATYNAMEHSTFTYLALSALLMSILWNQHKRKTSGLRIGNCVFCHSTLRWHCHGILFNGCARQRFSYLQWRATQASHLPILFSFVFAIVEIIQIVDYVPLSAYADLFVHLHITQICIETHVAQNAIFNSSLAFKNQ